MCANEPDIHERIENDETAYQDSDVLEHLYHVEGLTQGEIGELFGVTKSPVSDWMDKHEIETRSQSEASLRSVLKLPACFFTGDDGYEYWTTKHYENREQVYVHRLLAVAKFGFEEVCDAQVHHRNGVRWDNRAENIEVLSVQSHRKKHRKVSEDKILTAISEKQESGSATVESIADTVGLDTSHAYRRLRDLISDGKIHSTKEQHSRGGFRLHYHLNTPSGGSEG
jgi:DNA-binding MarR family transcriptional regulator